MAVAGCSNATPLSSAEATLKEMDTYKFDEEFSVTVQVIDNEPTAMEPGNNSSSSHSSTHSNQAVTQTLNANHQPQNPARKYYLALDKIAQNLSDILCKYYILRAYATSKKEWKDFAPYYTDLKTYCFSTLASDVAEYILPQSGNSFFVKNLLQITLALARKTSENPKLGTYDDVRCLFSEMLRFASRKRKLPEKNPIPIRHYVDKSQQTEPLYVIISPPATALPNPINQNQNEYLNTHLESPMPVITHVTSLNPYKQAVREGHCVLCSKVTGKICVGCYKNYYCSNTCQTLDWDKHKDVCVLPI